MVIQFNKLLWTKIRTAEILSDADGDNQAAFSDGNISPECDINTNIYPHPVVDMGDSVVIVKKVTDTSLNKCKSDQVATPSPCPTVINNRTGAAHYLYSSYW